MELVRIFPEDPRFAKAYSLYERSFCIEERRDYNEVMRVLKDDKYHFNILLNDGEYVGIMLTWEFENSLYLEHFAIEEDKRGQKLGTQAINMLINNGKRVILEIEVPDDVMKEKRKQFYLTNNFFLNSHHHIQPKYHLNDEDLILLIMSSGRTITEDEYKEFYDNLLKYVEIPGIKH